MGSYKEEPASRRIVFRRMRLCGESGVVEAKYERKEVAVEDSGRADEDEAYEEAGGGD